MPNKRVVLPVIDPARCTGCGWCVAACPDHLLVLEVTAGKKSATLVNAERCPGCAKCIPACNFGAIRMRSGAARPPAQNKPTMRPSSSTSIDAAEG